MQSDTELSREVTRIVTVVGFYFFVSISLVFLNKNLMSPEFQYPLFITWYQLIVALIMVYILGHIGRSFEPLSMIPPIQFDLEVAKKISILSAIFVGMVSFNNLCLLYVEVTFYQVARSLTICFTILFTKSILQQDTSWPAIRASAVVMLGFVLGSAGEVNFSWFGVIFGVTSSAFVSLNGIYVKKAMAYVGNDQWRLLTYNTIISIAFMLPLIWISGEFTTLFENELFYDRSNWINMTVSGVLGFLINIAVYLQIKFTSPLTNNISGTLKACIQTVLAMMVYRNPISLLNAIGIILVIYGSFLYSHVRYSEMKNRTTPLPTVNVEKESEGSDKSKH